MCGKALSEQATAELQEIESVDGTLLTENEYELHIDNGPVVRVERVEANEWIPLDPA